MDIEKPDPHAQETVSVCAAVCRTKKNSEKHRIVLDRFSGVKTTWLPSALSQRSSCALIVAPALRVARASFPSRDAAIARCGASQRAEKPGCIMGITKGGKEPCPNE